MGWDGMGWDGRTVGQLFFFGPYLENYLIIFHNGFRPPKYMFLHVFWNIRRKKIGMFYFSKNFAKIKNPLFFDIFFKNFPNFSKTAQYFFLIVFGPLRRFNKPSFEKNSKNEIEFYYCQKISQLFFLRKNFGRKK